MGIVLILICIFMVSSFIAIFIVKAKLYSPLVIHSLIWLFTMSVGLVVYHDFMEINTSSVWALLIWFFTVYSILIVFELAYKLKISANIIGVGEFSNQLLPGGKNPLIWPVIIIVSLFCVWEVYHVGLAGNGPFLLNLRLALILDDYNGPKLQYTLMLYLILTALFVVCIYYEGVKSKNSLALLCWQIIFCVATASKFAIVTPFLIIIVIELHQRRITKKQVLIASVFILLLMLLMHLFRISPEDNSLLSHMFGTYIYSPLLALGLLPDQFGAVSNEFGQYTFRFFYAVTHSLGLLNILPKATILDYVYVPSPINVYSIMQPFYSDFGLMGIFFGGVFYGLFFGVLYKAALSKQSIYFIIYSLLIISLATSFFAETLITNLSGNIKLTLCTVIVYWGYLWRVKNINQQ
ncbi:MAG: O-antigen polymerase [Turicibacter sp.]